MSEVLIRKGYTTKGLCVELVVDGVVVDRAGGQRATRAKVALVIVKDGKPGLYRGGGLRTDWYAAEVEARSARRHADVRVLYLGYNGESRRDGTDRFELETAGA